MPVGPLARPRGRHAKPRAVSRAGSPALAALLALSVGGGITALGVTGGAAAVGPTTGRAPALLVYALSPEPPGPVGEAAEARRLRASRDRATAPQPVGAPVEAPVEAPA
ncbi:MAG TPA: hypothetical protein VM433_00670, partial [Mycobacteriales bacterium]|nr:hypothetical protein [Mycobacteriales bacterium]